MDNGNGEVDTTPCSGGVMHNFPFRRPSAGRWGTGESTVVCDAWPVPCQTLSDAERHRPLAITKLYCLGHGSLLETNA